MFSSGKKERVTADPTPWQHVHCDGDDSRAPYKPDFRFVHRPRPEFDRSLTNPVNPILSDFRENCPKVSGDDIEDYLEMLALLNTEHYRTPTGRAQIAHARAVLTRLAAAGKGKAA